MDRASFTVIAAVIGANAICMIAFFMLTPTITIRLEHQHQPRALIGLITTFWSFAVLACGWGYPAIVARIGALPALLCGLATTGTLLSVYPFVESPLVWLGLSFVSGAAYGLFWVVSETWMNSVSPESHRSRITALYSMTLGLGASGGPFLLGFVGTDGVLPFLIMTGFVYAALLPFLALRRVAPSLDYERHQSVGGLVRRAPLIAIVGCVAGFSDGGIPAMFPAFVIDSGFTAERAVELLFAFGLGRLVLQLPVGYLADHFERRVVLCLSAAGCGVLAILLPQIISGPVWFAALFLWGGCIDSFYAVGLSIVGQRFSAGELASGNTLFVMSHSVGSFSSAPLIGTAMDLLGPGGYPAMIATVAGTAAAATLLSVLRQRRASRR